MRFLVCIHDTTPAYARETLAFVRHLAPLIGRRLSLAVVPDWHGEWPLQSHREHCRLLRESADELLLHGYRHERRRGWGATSWLAERTDEMNDLDPDETRDALQRGQRAFTDVFGLPARGFLAPAWQLANVKLRNVNTLGFTYVLGFFSLSASDGSSIPLSTWSWDCGRWGWLGHVGHGIGSLSHSLTRGVPVIAIHPRDMERGFWPAILRLTRTLVERGFEPTTPSDLLAAHVDVAA